MQLPLSSSPLEQEVQKEELEQVKQGEVQTEQIDHPNEESMKKPELQEKLSMHID